MSSNISFKRSAKLLLPKLTRSELELTIKILNSTTTIAQKSRPRVEEEKVKKKRRRLSEKEEKKQTLLTYLRDQTPDAEEQGKIVSPLCKLGADFVAYFRSASDTIVWNPRSPYWSHEAFEKLLEDRICGTNDQIKDLIKTYATIDQMDQLKVRRAYDLIPPAWRDAQAHLSRVIVDYRREDKFMCWLPAVALPTKKPVVFIDSPEDLAKWYSARLIANHQRFVIVKCEWCGTFGIRIRSRMDMKYAHQECQKKASIEHTKRKYAETSTFGVADPVFGPINKRLGLLSSRTKPLPKALLMERFVLESKSKSEKPS